MKSLPIVFLNQKSEQIINNYNNSKTVEGIYERLVVRIGLCDKNTHLRH
jgi:hypothetical protein